MRNIHNQVEDTQKIRAKFLQENMTRNAQSLTQHYYLTKMANATIDEDTGVVMDHRHQEKKHQIIDQFGSNTSPMI